ncbi:MAG TPA: site-2 protease family protein, partial [Lacipirellulaceae bacterium]|nr:site-2 protease family protein [Lacipirellulaceae bacterium]
MQLMEQVMHTELMDIGLIVAVSLSSTLSLIAVILKVAVGLGAVIFVHELGHFLVAKACGVKIEKFMIGFDIGGYRLAWRRGETLYGIGIVPLGGYVKMLGQDDDPAHIAEQMQKSQVRAGSGEGVEIFGPKGEKYYVDRRSYLAKSVPQRMAIISAGVVMNVIFAFIFAVVAYGMGVPYYPSIVSETSPGSPAWRAGLESGDEIIQIGETVNPTFTQLRGGVTLGDLENGIPIVVRRAANQEEVRVILKPEHGSGELATIGVSPPQSLTINKTLPASEGSPAARAKLVSPSADQIATGETKFQGGDEIIRVGDVPVKSYRDYSVQLAANPDKPLQITVRRPPAKSKDGVAESDAASAGQELTFEVPSQSMNRLGLVMNMSPIAAIRAGSPAENVFKVGDVIELVDGRPMGDRGGEEEAESWDSDTLPEYAQRAAAESRDIEFTVKRTGAANEPEQMTLKVTPVVPTMFHSFHPPAAPESVNSVGFAYHVGNEVADVVPGSPAAKTDLKAGDIITVAKVVYPPDSKGKTPDPFIARFVADEAGWLTRLFRSIFGGEEAEPRAVPSWPMLLDALQFVDAGTKVELTVKRPGEEAARSVTLEPASAKDTNVAPRGLNFELIERIRTASSFGEQVRLGWDETTEALGMVFRFLQKLGTQVPFTALGGPGTIAMVAGSEASKGLPSFLVFLTMLSANLAVLNFLPIPLLDGGHIVFLAYEGIRGRPA